MYLSALPAIKDEMGVMGEEKREEAALKESNKLIQNVKWRKHLLQLVHLQTCPS